MLFINSYHHHFEWKQILTQRINKNNIRKFDRREWNERKKCRAYIAGRLQNEKQTEPREKKMENTPKTNINRISFETSSETCGGLSIKGDE